MNIHFISGLPRSGGSLLSALLQQNLTLHSRFVSPLYHIIADMERSMSPLYDTSGDLIEEEKLNMMRAVFSAYYARNHGQIKFDSSQYWTGKQALLGRLFPDSVMICVVRDLVDILNSFEHLYQKYPLYLSKFYGFNPHTTIASRASFLCSSDGPVGKAWDGLSELYHSAREKKSILFLEYSDVVRFPMIALNKIHTKINAPMWEYSDNLDAHLPDTAYEYRVNMPNLLFVGHKVKAVSRKLILPPDLVKQYSGREFWRGPTSSLAVKYFQEAGSDLV